MDIVISSVVNYSYDQIKYWINSLNRSGFEGKKYLLMCNYDYDTRRKIEDQGVTTVSFDMGSKDNIVVVRFWAYWQLLNTIENNQADPLRYVIATDVKDVIFQSNPSVWLSNYAYGDIILSSESLRYINEPWGFENIASSFGDYIRGAYAYHEIVNCGVLAGEFDTMKDLFLNIYMLCRGTIQYVPGGGGPDQAALNILSGLGAYKGISQVTNPWNGWAAQLGTTNDPRKIESFKPHLLHASPIYKDGLFVTPEKAQTPLTPYSIVHQWDRMEHNVVKEIEEKYS